MDFKDEEKNVFSKMAKKRWNNMTDEQKSAQMKEIRRKGIERQKEMERKLASQTPEVL